MVKKDDDDSRIVAPDVLAASLGLDVASEEQAAIDSRIEESFRRFGPLANLRGGIDEGSSFVGSISEHTLADIMLHPLGGRLIQDRASGRFYLFEESTVVFKQITREELWCALALEYARLPLLSSKLAPLQARPASVRLMKSLAEGLAALTGENYPFGGDPDERETVIRKPVANGILTFDLHAGDEMPLFRKGFAAADRALHRAPVAYECDAARRPSRLMEELLIPSLGGEGEAEAFIDDLAAAWAGGALWPFVFALIGAADSGKSQIVEMLRIMHGRPHWCALSSRNVGDKFGASFLAGPVRVVSFTDAKGNALCGEVGELVKALTGSDVREDRGPHAQLLVSIKGDKIFVLTSNAVPHVDLEDDAAAWVRRVRPWRFQPYEPAKRIPDFGTVLLEQEGAALLNRLIDGVRRRILLRREGRRPDMLPCQSALLDEILRRSCPVASFLGSRVVADRGSQIKRGQAYSDFCDWLRAERRNTPQWSRDMFNRRAAEVMKRDFGASLSHSIDGGDKGWRSVRWKTQAEMEND